MVSIDHQYFPHIIDNIWRHLDWAGVSVMRKTSTAYRERAQDVLHKSKHLAIDYRRDRAELRARHWSRPSEAPLLCRSLGEVYIKVNSENDKQDEKWWFWADLLASATTVDFIGYSRTMNLEYHYFVKEEVRNVDTIRCYWPSSTYVPAIPCTTMVLFIKLVYVWDSPLVQLYTEGESASYPTTVVINLKVGFCLTSFATNLKYLFSTQNEDPDHCRLRELIVILHSYTKYSASPVPGSGGDLILGYLNAIRRESSGLTVTIVGLERFFSDSYYRAHFIQWLRTSFQGKVKSGTYDLDKRWVFLTHEEYEENVGEADYRLYTGR